MSTTSTPSVTTNEVVQVLGNGAIAVGDEDSKIGFFGATPVSQLASAGITDFATLKAALQSIGLIAS